MTRQLGAPETSGLEEYQRLLSLLDERRFEEAQVRARVLLESSDTGLLVRAKTHNLICWAFIEGLKRAAPEAVLHGEEAVRIARRLGEHALVVQAAFNLASAFYQVGTYESAWNTYQEILGILGANPSLLPFGAVIARQGLAQIALLMGRPREALDFLEGARAYCRDDESHFLLADLHRRRALVLLKLNLPDEAARALAEINDNAYSSGPRSLWWKTNLGYTRARVEMALGRFSAARPLVQTALALARELADLPVLAEATCLLALIEQAEGRKEAPRRARQALTYAIHSGRRDVADDIRDRLKEFLGADL